MLQDSQLTCCMKHNFWGGSACPDSLDVHSDTSQLKRILRWVVCMSIYWIHIARQQLCAYVGHDMVVALQRIGRTSGLYDLLNCRSCQGSWCGMFEIRAVDWIYDSCYRSFATWCLHDVRFKAAPMRGVGFDGSKSDAPCRLKARGLLVENAVLRRRPGVWLHLHSESCCSGRDWCVPRQHTVSLR